MKQFVFLFLFFAINLFSNPHQEIKDALEEINSLLISDFVNNHQAIPESLSLQSALQKVHLYLKIILAEINESEATLFHCSLISFQAIFTCLFHGYGYFFSERIVTCEELNTHCTESIDPAFKIAGPVLFSSICFSATRMWSTLQETDKCFQDFEELEIPKIATLKELKTKLLLHNQPEIAEYITLLLNIHNASDEPVPERLDAVFFGTQEQKTWIKRLINHFWHKFF